MFLTFSCDERKRNENIHEADSSVNQVDNGFKEISAFDNESELRAKVKKTAELDDADFKEARLYDDFFKDQITKFSISQKGSKRNFISLVVYRDTLRCAVIHMLHIGKQTSEKALMNNIKIERKILKSVKEGVYIKEDNYFLKQNVNNENWYLTIFVNQHKIDGRQDYWTLSVPETEYDYLKFMANNFKSKDELLVKFLLK